MQGDLSAGKSSRACMFRAVAGARVSLRPRVSLHPSLLRVSSFCGFGQVRRVSILPLSLLAFSHHLCFTRRCCFRGLVYRLARESSTLVPYRDMSSASSCHPRWRGYRSTLHPLEMKPEFQVQQPCFGPALRSRPFARGFRHADWIPLLLSGRDSVTKISWPSPDYLVLQAVVLNDGPPISS